MTWEGLLDFSNLEGNAICGLDQVQIDEIVNFQQAIVNLDQNENTSLGE